VVRVRCRWAMWGKKWREVHFGGAVKWLILGLFAIWKHSSLRVNYSQGTVIVVQKLLALHPVMVIDVFVKGHFTFSRRNQYIFLPAISNPLSFPSSATDRTRHPSSIAPPLTHQQQQPWRPSDINKKTVTKSFLLRKRPCLDLDRIQLFRCTNSRW
jgi:hypothetical protein